MAPSLVRLAAVAFAAALTVTASACTASPDVSDEDTDVAEGQLVSFVCDRAEITKNNPNAPFAQVVDVRAAGHDGFDRFVMQFAAGHPDYDRFVMEFKGSVNVPNFSVKLRDNATFHTPADPFTLPGTAGLDVNAFHASGFDFATGQLTYTGPRTITPTSTDVLLKARQYEDFEGHVGWGLGLERATCYRAFKLANPPRLVVDVQR